MEMKWLGYNIDVYETDASMDDMILDDFDFPQVYSEKGYIYITFTAPVPNDYARIIMKFDDLLAEGMRLNRNTLDDKDYHEDLDSAIENIENILSYLKKLKKE